MKKVTIILVVFMLFKSQIALAQVGINNDGTQPTTGAILDVKGSSNVHFYIDDATGKVGIGTVSPTSILDIIGDISIQGRIFERNNGYSIFIGDYAGEDDDLSDNKNVFIGYLSGSNNTSGDYNVAIGESSLQLNTTGAYNTAIGAKSLRSSNGSRNTALGYYALYNNTASYNVAIGQLSLKSNTTGTNNTAVGSSALKNNINTSYNTAVGFNSLYDNTAYKNTAIGNETLRYNTSGYENSATGYQSLYSNTEGFYNTAIGSRTLFNNIDGDGNTAIGYNSLLNNKSNSNTSVGYRSASANINGSENAALGDYSLYKNQDGTHNTAIGSHAFYNGTSYSNSTAIGYFAPITASNQIRIGNIYVTSIGGYRAWSNLSDGRFKTNVKSNVVGLDFILKLRPVTYNLDINAINKFNNVQSEENLTNNELQCGFIAQEVDKAAQEVNFNFHGVDKPKNSNDYYSLRYAEFVVPIVKAVQEQQEMINVQKQQILQLQNEIEELKSQIKELKSQNK